MRNRSKLGPKNLALLDEVIVVLEELEDYLPLTLRQLYYQLVSKLIIENCTQEYKRLGSIMTKARIEGLVPWAALEDRTRSLLGSDGWGSMGSFIDRESEDFLAGYRRDLLQTQSSRLEIWIEKDALSRVVHNVAFEYCVPVVVARGFSSISFVKECADRVIAHYDHTGDPTQILYFGDLDPSGWEMLPAMLETLHEELDVPEDALASKRCALRPEQVDELNLPHNPNALKMTDSRAKKYLDRFGPLAVELDAVPPPVLETMVEDSIRRNIDLNDLGYEKAEQATEREKLSRLRESVVDFIDEERGDG